MNDWYGLTRVFCLIVTALLLGCAEGGTGGTGGITPLADINAPLNDVVPASVSISGYSHKGPYQVGSTVRVTQLSETGESGVVRGTTVIVSNLGDYQIIVESDGPLRIDVAGRYFSETVGEFTDAGIELSAIINPISEDTRANVNLLTHLIHSRVRQLIDAGSIDVGQAIEMAQSEFLLAFSNLLPAPDSATVFSNLLIINSVQQGDDETGNAYLLALSSVLEQYAANLAATNNTEPLLELVNFTDQLAADLADDGALDLWAEVAEDLQQAMAELNPPAIYLNLLRIDELLDLAIEASDLESSELAVFSETVLVVADAFEFSVNVDSDNPLTATIALREIVANIDLFIDTDGDGLVNRDDDDDDGDGIADMDDDTPYGDGE